MKCIKTDTKVETLTNKYTILVKESIKNYISSNYKEYTKR
jgi:hypothetical protein